MHTVWTGGKEYSNTDQEFAQRDRVAADYAGWVAAGADRVIELLGSRDGVVSVYGDVHNGCIMKNTDHGLIECSFGPIGRSGGRSVITGFGREMKDYDGRPLEVTALYHKTHADPDLNGQLGLFLAVACDNLWVSDETTARHEPVAKRFRKPNRPHSVD